MLYFHIFYPLKFPVIKTGDGVLCGTGFCRSHTGFHTHRGLGGLELIRTAIWKQLVE